jgi:hypothetical protein
MNLDNARDLKKSLLSKAVKALSAPSAVRAMGVRAQTSAVANDPLRTVALGIGRSGKRHTLAVRLQRRALINHPMVEEIRKKAKGEVDVRYVGRLVKLETPATLQKRRRPLVIGCSIGHFSITAGTLGCFVKARRSGVPLILSNNHVLANENDATAGDAIIQPGSFDNGRRPRDVVARLRKFVKLSTGAVNFVDCADATLTKSLTFDAKTLGAFGTLAGLGPQVVVDGTAVRKVGRTTGETSGRVTAFELDNVVVGYDIGNLRFDDQIEIEGAGMDAFSDGGDSGSLIVDEDLKAVGLLFAGGDSGGTNGQGLTYANPIHRVLDALKVDLLT